MNRKPNHEVNDPTALRRIYFDAWQKHLAGSLLNPMESIIVDLIQNHPEYHPLFETPQHYENIEQEKFTLESNPFFHLGLHIAIKEQVMMDKPLGVRALYHTLLRRFGNELQAEHQMIPALTQTLMSYLQKEEEAHDFYMSALRKMID